MGAAHQRHAGDAGRKAEVILDPRRGAGLAAEGAAVEHQHGQAFGGGIDRGGKARWTGADDNHVIEFVGIDRPDQPDTPGELELARIAQQLAVGADNNRQFAGRYLKPFDQRLPARIGGRVEPLVRVAVAGEEPFEPQHVAIVGAADNDRAARADLKQADTAQDQRPHDALAELRFRDQQVAQPARRDDKRLDGLFRHGVNQRRPARELRQLAHERARIVRHERVGMTQPALADLDPSRQDEEGARRDVAGREDALAGRVGFALAEAPQPIAFRRCEHRKHLIASGLEERRHGWRHEFLAAARRRLTKIDRALDPDSGFGNIAPPASV